MLNTKLILLSFVQVHCVFAAGYDDIVSWWWRTWPQNRAV